MNAKSEFALLADVARTLGCQPHRIVYLLSSGQVPEPALRLGNRRIFTRADIDRIAAKLGSHAERSP
jgi:DNA-binding transcriptional MerR regulator